jgi:hypothetical protein
MYAVPYMVVLCCDMYTNEEHMYMCLQVCTCTQIIHMTALSRIHVHVLLKNSLLNRTVVCRIARTHNREKYSLVHETIHVLHTYICTCDKTWFMAQICTIQAAIALPQQQYAGHSFRIGTATTIAEKAGIEDSTIQTLGWWHGAAFSLSTGTNISQGGARGGPMVLYIWHMCLYLLRNCVEYDYKLSSTCTCTGTSTYMYVTAYCFFLLSYAYGCLFFHYFPFFP